MDAKKLILSAMFVAVGVLLPILTANIPEIGMMLLPMHIPVMLAGLILGYRYGLLVGIIVPLLRSFIFGMPVFMPMGISMAFELGTYGLVIGLVYALLRKPPLAKYKSIISLYISMIVAMIMGRIVWGIAMFILVVSINGGMFTLSTFWMGAFVNAVPGIVLQLVLIPIVMVALGRARIIQFPN